MKRENISDALDMLDEELLSSVMTMREQKETRNISISKLAGIILAAVFVLSATVLTAMANYTFTIDPKDTKDLLEEAYYYARYETDDLDERALFTYCWDEYRYDESIEGKLSGLRRVYNIKFKVAGYAYDIDVDMSGIVTKCNKTVDSDWENRFDDYEGYERERINTLIMHGDMEPEVTVGEIKADTAYDIFMDYFNLDEHNYYLDSGDLSIYYVPGKETVCDYSTDPMTINLGYEHGGYIYRCRINSVTGEVTDVSVTPIEENEFPVGKHLHKHEESEYIGRYRAGLIALETLGLSNDYWPRISINFASKQATMDIYDAGAKTAGKIPDNVDCYYRLSVRDRPNNDWTQGAEITYTVVYIDGLTGEVFAVVENAAKSTQHTIVPVSAEAPKGMISEADAQLIAFEDAGIEAKKELGGFEIELVDGKYEIYVLYHRHSFEWEYDYTIDAVSGEILSRTRR